MANWLSKIIPPAPPANQGSGPNRVPATTETSVPPAVRPTGPAPQPAHLPNASIVYGIAASILFVVALLTLFHGAWLTGFLIMLPAAGFLGFALHFLKYPNS